VSEPEILNERSVGHQVGIPEIRQETLPLTDHLEQAAPTVMVFGMDPEVIREGLNALGEKGHLDFGRPGVGFVLAVLRHDGLLVVPHSAFLGCSAA
jgi:hypothetical protein